MKNPNGYGSVVKLSGKRRRPYMVRKTTGYDDRGYPIYAIIGYTATRAEGNMMLAEYNKSPYDVGSASATVAQVYNGWSRWAESQLAPGTIKNMKSAYSKLSSIYDMKYRDVSVAVMQEIVSTCSPGTQGNIKTLFAQLDSYAAMSDIITKRNSEFLTIIRPETKEKAIFSEGEIDTLWKHTDDEAVCATLIMIYSGWRISEYLSMDIDYDGNVMRGGMKTAAGKNRTVPIHPRILPLLRTVGDKRDVAYIVFRSRFDAAMKRYGLSHTIHECRHTFVSRLDTAGVPRIIIDKLAGHKNGSTGEIVYTHKTYDELYAGIIKLK